MPRPRRRPRSFTALAAVASALFVLAAAPLPARSASDGQRELDLARTARQGNDLGAAADHLRRAVARLDPASERAGLAQAYLELGQVTLALGRGEEALAAFLASAGLGSDPQSAYLWAATAAEELGRPADAATYKARALGVAPPAVNATPRPARASAPAPASAAPTPPPSPPPAPTQAPPAPEPAPSPSPEAPAGTAFQHFFGASAAAPQATPASSPARPTTSPAPSPSPAQQPATGAAFQHFFGAAAAEAPAATTTGPSPSPAAAATATAAPSPAKSEPAKDDAFKFFFGKKTPAAQPSPSPAPSASPSPPRR